MSGESALFSGMRSDELLQLVYHEFRKTGDWPRADVLEVQLRRKCHFRALASEIPDKLVLSGGKEDLCFLHIEGLVQCAGSEADVESFLKAVRYTADATVKRPGRPIRVRGMRTKLRLDDAEAKRLFGILDKVPSMWSSSPGDWMAENAEVTPSKEMIYFEKVRTIDEYFACRREVRQKQFEAARPYRPRMPQEVRSLTSAARLRMSDLNLSGMRAVTRDLNFYKPKLGETFQQDLEEVEVAVENGASKAAAVLIGSCLEAVLLDLWHAHGDDAAQQWKKKWPDEISLDQLLKKAVESGHLSAVQSGLADTIRQARNLIHPLRAAKHGRVGPELADVLFRALMSICQELSNRGTSLDERTDQ